MCRARRKGGGGGGLRESEEANALLRFTYPGGSGTARSALRLPAAARGHRSLLMLLLDVFPNLVGKPMFSFRSTECVGSVASMPLV